MAVRKVRAPPMMVLAVVLLVALTTLGVSYGLWSKTLTIDGKVHTGEVDAKWKFAGCFEFYPWPEGGNDGEVGGVDVGSWEIWIDPDDDQILHFVVDNGYPSYAVECEVEFEVEGTIPVIVRGTTIVPGDNLTNCTLSGRNSKTLECDQLTVKFVDNLGSQLHPGDEAASSLKVHVEQPAEEETTYTFQVLVCMAQWNEDATADECYAAAP
jgi:hypothetical protein